MNILVIPSWYENISKKTEGSFFREQAESLAKLGHNVYVLYSDIISIKDPKRILKTPAMETYTKNGIIVYRVRKIKKYKSKNGSGPYMCRLFTNGVEKLYRRYIMNKIKIDVIHAHSCIWGGAAAVSLKSKYNIPVMITEHYTAFSRGVIKENEKELIKKTIKESDRVVAVSSGLSRDMLPYSGDKAIGIIPNMVDVDRFNYNKYKNIPQEDSGNVTFLAVCYLMQKKGLDILLKAFREAFLDVDNVRLIIGGGGEEFDNLKKITKELNLENMVSFLGYITREQVAECMSKCNCFVLPSRFETFGVVYIEALAMGKPVIATNTDAIGEIIDENNGLVVEKENIHQLSESLRYMKANYQRYSSEAISDNCIKKFGTETVAKKIEKELLEIANI